MKMEIEKEMEIEIEMVVEMIAEMVVEVKAEMEAEAEIEMEVLSLIVRQERIFFVLLNPSPLQQDFLHHEISFQDFLSEV